MNIRICERLDKHIFFSEFETRRNYYDTDIPGHISRLQMHTLRIHRGKVTDRELRVKKIFVSC